MRKSRSLSRGGWWQCGDGRAPPALPWGPLRLGPRLGGSFHLVDDLEPGWTSGVPGVVFSLAIGTFCFYGFALFVFGQALLSSMPATAESADLYIGTPAVVVSVPLALEAP